MTSEINVCTCSHKRNKHEGYRSLQNRNVYECKEDKCTCTDYSPNPNSTKLTAVQNKYAAFFLGLIVSAIIGAVLIASLGGAIDSKFSSYSEYGLDNIREEALSGNMTAESLDEALEDNHFSKGSGASGIAIFVLFVVAMIAFVFLIDKFEAERKIELLE